MDPQACSPLDIPHWDETVCSWPGHSIFHSCAWARVLQDAYGYRPLYLIAENPSRMMAMLPLMEVNSWLTGHRGVSLPFADFCPVLAQETQQAQLLINQACHLGQSRHWKYIEFRGTDPPMPNARVSVQYYGHRLELTGGESALFAALDPSARRAIRKAETSGLTIEISSSKPALETYYTLHCHTRQKHGLPPQPKSFFNAIHHQILQKDLGWIVLARYQNLPVAGAVFFHFGDQVLFKFGASKASWQHLRGNNLVMWESIKHAAHKGFKTLFFGRTSDFNLGLRRFKRSFGTLEYPIGYFKYHLQSQQFLAKPDRPFFWYNRVFQLMPLFCSRMIGSLFYKHLG